MKGENDQCVITIAAVASAQAAVARAEKTAKERSQVVYHFVNMEVMQVGDVPAHIPADAWHP